jgi:formamidopyrimidine-DNA glycosylase
MDGCQWEPGPMAPVSDAEGDWCPACDAPLSHEEADSGRRVYTCERCQYVWVDLLPAGG